jgi:hypothetical protein
MTSDSPLFIADTQLVLPHPEWQTLAQEARRATSFARQLTGDGMFRCDGCLCSTDIIMRHGGAG